MTQPEEIEFQAARMTTKIQSSNHLMKTKKKKPCSQQKPKAKHKNIRSSVRLDPIQLGKGLTFKQQLQESLLYASLLDDDNEIDQQAHFGPWVKVKERSTTLNSQVKKQPITDRSSTSKDPVMFKILSANKILEARFRSGSLLNQRKIVPFVRKKKEKSIFTIKKHQNQNLCSPIKKIQAKSRYQPVLISQSVVSISRRTSVLNFNAQQSNKQGKFPQYTWQNTYLRKHLQSINIQPPDTFINRVFTNPKLCEGTYEKNRPSQKTKNNVFSSTNTRLYEFAHRIPDRGHRTFRNSEVSPFNNSPKLMLLTERKHPQYHSLSKSLLCESPNNNRKTNTKFDKVLFVDKYRFSRPSMNRNKSSRTTSIKSRSKRNSEEGSIRTLYTNFESPRQSEISKQFSNNNTSIFCNLKKGNTLQERLSKLCGKQAPEINKISQLKRVSKNVLKGNPLKTTVAIQTDPISLADLCPTLEHKLRLLELENQQIKRLLKSKLRLSSL